jgi:integrase
VTFQPGTGFRKDVGREIVASGRVRYRRFWLGHDAEKARDLARLIRAEWTLLLTHGGRAWTPEALRRIEAAKKGTADPRATGALAPVPPPPVAPPVVQPVVAPVLPLPQQAVLPPPAPAGAAPGQKHLYDAVAEYVAGAKSRADAGQLAMGRWLNLSYSLDRLKRAVADRPLVSIGFKEVRAIVDHFAGRPRSHNNGRKLAASTAIDTIVFTRAFFAHLADVGDWSPPATLAKLFKFDRKKLHTDEELDAQAEVKVFSVGELAALWRSCANELQQLMFLLALNTGQTQAEIATLRPAHCHLDHPGPYVKRRRHKTRVVGRWGLWPETAALLRKALAKSADPERVLTNKRGDPLVFYRGRHRYDTVRGEWDKVLARAARHFAWWQEHEAWRPPHQRPAGYRAPVQTRRLPFKYLRKTSGDLVRRIGGKDMAEVFLSHADQTMARVYTNRDFKRLDKALRKMRRRLEPVLGPVEPHPLTPVEPVAERGATATHDERAKEVLS